MLLPGEAVLFSPCGMVTATALKWSCTSVTVGNLVVAITVRVIVDGAGGVCALAEAASATELIVSNPIVGNRMMASANEYSEVLYLTMAKRVFRGAHRFNPTLDHVGQGFSEAFLIIDEAWARPPFAPARA